MKNNNLVTALPKAEREHLLAECKLVTLQAGTLLAQSGRTLRYVYFPIDCYVALESISSGATRLGVGLVGAEGMIGGAVILGAGGIPAQAVVHGSGVAWRLSRRRFLKLTHALPNLRRRALLYLYHSIENVMQHANCSHFHLTEARLAHWLMLIRDRAGSDQFNLTQKMLAELLGVRRVGITLAARALQQLELIDYRRGRITIRNRRGLVAAASECHGQVETSYRNLLG